MRNRNPLLAWLVLGDALALLVFSAIGFLTHNEAVGWPVLTTFLPFLASWGMVAPWLGVYAEPSRDARQVWRPALAAFLAAPMAAWLRALWLNRAILPVFVTALAFSAAFAIAVWRLLWILIVKRMKTYG